MDSPAPSVSMPSTFARLIKQSGLYALGSLAVKASGLLLAPIYLNESLLSQVAFGQLVILEATAQIAIPFIGLGLSTGLLKFMTESGLEREREAVPFTTLVTSCAISLLALLILWALAPLLAGALLDGRGAAYLVRLMAVYVIMKVMAAVPFMLIRSQERVALYVVATLMETALLIGGVYYLLRYRHLGLEGVIWAYVFSAGASALILSAGMLARVRWRVKLDVVMRLIRFGAPLAVAGVAMPFLHVGDRYLLEWLADTREVAIYGWAAKLSGVLNMFVVQSFQLAFTVIGLKSLSSESGEGAALHRRAFRHYTIGAGWMALGLALVAYDVTDLFSSSRDYLQAAPIVLPLSLGFLVYGYYAISVSVIYAQGNARVVAIGVTGATVLNAVLNVVLIPFLGGMGAALATFVAYLVLAVGTTRVAQRHVSTVFPWKVLLYVLVFVVGLWAAAQPSFGWTPGLRFLWLGLLILAYPALVLASGLYARQEIVQGWQWTRQRISAWRHSS